MVEGAGASICASPCHGAAALASQGQEPAARLAPRVFIQTHVLDVVFGYLLMKQSLLEFHH